MTTASICHLARVKRVSFPLGYCDKCRYKERDTLFVSHVARVARYVKEKHKVTPIIWDDMLRQISIEKIKEAQLGSLVEPMVWTYIKGMRAPII